MRIQPKMMGASFNGTAIISSYSPINASDETNIINFYGGARGVMVIVVGNGHGDMSSNPEQDCLHFS